MGKNKAGGDFWDEEESTETQPTAPDGEIDSTEPVPQQVDEAQEEAGGLLGALKKSKQKKQDKAGASAAAAAEAAANEISINIKSKKDKEREKKEREKARKKAQAERSKAATVVEAAPSQESLPEASDPTDNGIKEAVSSDQNVPESKAAKGPPKGKKIAAALQKQIAAQREAKAAKQAAEEEATRKKLEAERQIAEKRRLIEEERLRKQQEEEELRAQGKLLTKEELYQIEVQKKRREQLLASSGLIVPALDQTDGARKKPVYGKKKKKPESTKSAVTSTQPQAEAKPTQVEPEVKPSKPIEPEAPQVNVDSVDYLVSKLVSQKSLGVETEEPEFEDWEAGIDSDDEDTVKKKKPSAEHKEEAAKVKPPSEDAKNESVSTNQTSQPEPSKQPPKEDKSLQSAVAQAGRRKDELVEKRDQKMKTVLSKASSKDLRSPICCILGHVDTGKTKLLDKIRQTNVQEGEAGGITQQIGATYFPIEAIKQKTAVMQKHVTMDFTVPGLLIIDTPGHESFSNLRSRGSSLCNIAILVVDIMHGLEPQTLESIRLLRDRKTPFVVALNKIDRLYDWKTIPNNSFRDSLSQQTTSVQREFQDRLEKTKLAFAEQGLNSELYYHNKSMGRTVSLIPTSAVTGEGVPDLLYLLLELTTTRMSKQLMYLSHLEATVLEVKVIEGLGTTIDVVLSNGVLKEGDRIILCGQNGPIATNVRALLTPQPMRELRIKSAYVHHKEVKAALGVKIAANDLDKAVAGSRLLLVGPDDEEEDLMDEVMDDLSGLLDSVDKSGKGVCVQASTLGSLEALLDFLKDMKIPVMSISIGPVYKRDMMKASAMLEKAPELAIMMAFDVKIDKDAEQYATEQGIKVFSADIIYHLFDAFTKYQQELMEKRRRETIHEAVFPCVLRTIQIINNRNPLIIGVDVEEGSIRIGTPVAIVKPDGSGGKSILPLGRVASLEVNHKSVESVRKGATGAGVAMRLDNPSGSQPTWGRHFDEKDKIYSLISRRTIDVLKDPAFRNDVPRDDWLLIKNLKPIFDIK